MKFVKKIYRKAITYNSALLKNPKEPHKKFVIFFRPRAGSNLLCDLLNSHPDVYCDGEIFGVGQVGRVRFPKLYLKGRYAIAQKDIYGFKINIKQIRDQKFEAHRFFSDFDQQGGKIIYIRRGNHLRQAVSFLIAEYRSEWVGTPQNRLTGKVPVNPEELVSKIKRIEVAVQKEVELLAPYSTLNLIYENDLLIPEQQQTTLDSAFQFLDIEPVSVKTNMARTAASSNLAEVIENYDEVERVVSQTPYAHFLAEK